MTRQRNRWRRLIADIGEYRVVIRRDDAVNRIIARDGTVHDVACAASARPADQDVVDATVRKQASRGPRIGSCPGMPEIPLARPTRQIAQTPGQLSLSDRSRRVHSIPRMGLTPKQIETLGL